MVKPAVMHIALLMLFVCFRPCLASGQEKKKLSPQLDASPTHASTTQSQLSKATFAGGCFWCMESAFEDRPGVREVIAGYMGGVKENPTYEEVSSGTTGHREVVQVIFDPSQTNYLELLGVFWQEIDPTDSTGQFVDRGQQYTTAIFYHNDEQKRLAEKSKADLAASGRYAKPLATEIIEASTFYPAEEYHQDYYKKNTLRYQQYRSHSGRDAYLDTIWGKHMERSQTNSNQRLYRKPSDAEIRQKLSPLQYRVTRENGTEPAFDNEYWNNKREGIYVDIVSGEPLFSSLDKFDSGTGWPSFTKPLVPENVTEREDNSFFMKRTEVRSVHGDSHLGHVFDDGPPPTGRRYCMNSAAMRFIPKEDLVREGYGEYLRLFEQTSEGTRR